MPDSLRFVVDALTFPFRRGGIQILVMSTVLVVLADFAGIVPLLGFAVSGFVLVFLCGLYFELILLSTTPEKEIYSFPDLSDALEDIVYPALRVLGVLIVTFAPLIAWQIWGDESHQYGAEINLGLVLWGCLYFPMAMLATVVLGTLRAALPHVVLPGMVRAGPLYLVAAVLLSVLYFGEPRVLAWLEAYPILSIPVAGLIAIYVMMVNARTLGLLYHHREDELDWVYH